MNTRESALAAAAEQRRQEVHKQLLARLNPNEPAIGREWYLPLAGREHVAYPTRQAAADAGVRLCVQLGLPIVTPLSRTKGSA